MDKKQQILGMVCSWLFIYLPLSNVFNLKALKEMLLLKITLHNYWHFKRVSVPLLQLKKLFICWRNSFIGRELNFINKTPRDL